MLQTQEERIQRDWQNSIAQTCGHCPRVEISDFQDMCFFKKWLFWWCFSFILFFSETLHDQIQLLFSFSHSNRYKRPPPPHHFAFSPLPWTHGSSLLSPYSLLSLLSLPPFLLKIVFTKPCLQVVCHVPSTSLTIVSRFFLPSTCHGQPMSELLGPVILESLLPYSFFL